MYGASGDVNRVTRVNIDPLKKCLRPFLVNRFFELLRRNSWLKPQRNLGARFRVSNVPTLGLSPRLPHTRCLLIVGMNLYRKFLVREKKLEQQRESSGVACRIAHQLALIFLAQLRESFSGKRPVRYFAIVSAQPGLADFF